MLALGLGREKGYSALAGFVRVPGGPAGEAMRCLAAMFPGLPMLVVSAFDDAAPVAYAERFLKPFDTGALLDAVERQHRARPVTA